MGFFLREVWGPVEGVPAGRRGRRGGWDRWRSPGRDSGVEEGRRVRRVVRVTILGGVGRLVTIHQRCSVGVVGRVDVVGWDNRLHMGALCARSGRERREGSREVRRDEFHC